MKLKKVASLIQDVSDKRTAIFCAELLCHDVTALESGGKHINVSNINIATVPCSFTHIKYCNFMVILSFPIWIAYFKYFQQLHSSHFSKRSIVRWLYSDTESDWTVCNMSFENEQQQITWRLRVLYKFINFNSTLVICFRFAFYWNVRYKLITYIVCSYITSYEVSPIAWLKLLLNLQYNSCL